MTKEDQVQNPDAPMPEALKRVCLFVDIAFVALAVAVWLLFPDSTFAKASAVLLALLAFLPVGPIFVLEIANRISGGELKRTGKWKP